MKADRRNKPVPVALGLIACCVSLDIIVVINRGTAIWTLGRIACNLRPLGVLAKFLVPNHLSETVIADCDGLPTEPAISIIFLTFKITLGLLAFAAVLVQMAQAYLREGANEHDSVFGVPQMATSYFRQIGKNALAIVFLTALSVGGWKYSLGVAIERFNVTLPHKLFFEDLFILLGVMSLGTASGFILYGVMWPIQRAVSPLTTLTYPPKNE